jgi:ankyrin repeat protein
MGRYEMVKLLMEFGAKIDEQDKNGDTPLHIAARHEHLASPSIVNWLILHHANTEIKNKEGETPLHIAANYRANFIAELLLNAGADLNAQNNESLTPLMIAQRNGYQPTIDKLRKAQRWAMIQSCVIE